MTLETASMCAGALGVHVVVTLKLQDLVGVKSHLSVQTVALLTAEIYMSSLALFFEQQQPAFEKLYHSME